MVTARLLALTARKPGETPFQNGGPQRRASSPSGRSTLTTSAPRCAKTSAAYGPARFWASSTTLIPESGSIDVDPRSAEQRARDHHPMDFRWAFADPAHASLAIPALERKLLRHAVAAVDLDCRIDHPPQHLARI